MDFNYRNPLHLIALFLVAISFLIIIILPILTFVGFFPTTQSVQTQQVSESIRALSQVILLVIQLGFVFCLMVAIPFLWYVFVNKCSLKEIFSRIKFKLENIDSAFLWGILAAIIIFILIFVIESILIAGGQNSQDLSNIPDLESLFSWPALFFLVTVQPVAEEIFFRGFLFDKIEKFAGGAIAIIITSVLFGLAHLSYGKIFPVVMPIFMGMILGYIVYRTKNLYSSIIAHIIFNVTALTLAYIGEQILQQGALNLLI